ncbi:MAG: phytoene/squalene synthase family protein [Limisphaerales bacterium]
MSESGYEAAAIPHPQSPLLTALLRDVSRSFYLTLRVLPRPVRPQIGLAYLLARATDTIADTELVPLEDRLHALQMLRERIAGTRLIPVNFGALAERQSSPGERMLLERVEEALGVFGRFTYSDQQRIREVLSTIVSGQELDLHRFHGASARGIAALHTEDELDDYTYRVAGCVGEFWTRITRAHLFPGAPLDDAKLLHDGVRFGKGLQLVNILRDLPRDLRQGRCYLPHASLRAIGLHPADLLDLANEPEFRALYHSYLDKAAAHLAAGWEYTNSLPRRFVRVRLACAWPVLIGIKTVEKLRAANILDPRLTVKISRSEVRGIITRTLLRYPWPESWRRLYPLTDHRNSS